MYAWAIAPLERLRAARHRALVRQQVLLQVGGDGPRLARRAVPQRRVLVPPVGREARPEDSDHGRLHARRLVVRRAPPAQGGPPRRRLVPNRRGRGSPRADARHRAQHHPADDRGPDRSRGEMDPDRRAGRLHGGGRARRVRRELQRLGRGARGRHVLDASLLLRLRPLLPRDRGHERLPPVLRRLRELRHARARVRRARSGPATR